MSRRKKTVLGSLGVIIVAIVGMFVAKVHFSAKEEKAIQLAQEYLSQKYAQEMQFSYVRFVWIDPSLYHVYFNPIDQPELVFEVLVSPDLSLPQNKTNKYGFSTPDNYLLRRFQILATNVYKDIGQEIWKVNVQVSVAINDQPLYSFKTPAELNEQMSLEDMEPYVSYDIFFDIDHLLEETNKKEEAVRIYELIQIVNNSPYSPEQILFWYKTGKDKKGTVLTESKTWTERYIEFDNWRDITSLDQVIEHIDRQWNFLPLALFVYSYNSRNRLQSQAAGDTSIAIPITATARYRQQRNQLTNKTGAANIQYYYDDNGRVIAESSNSG